MPQHLGALHPVESLVMVTLALVPFAILAVVVAVVSRRDRRAEARGRAAGGQAAREEPPRPDGAGSTASDTAAPQSVQQ